MIIGMSFTKFLFFMPIGNPRWPPMGKCSNAFFSETTPVVSEKKLEM
jgi:hypothetical protein